MTQTHAHLTKPRSIKPGPHKNIAAALDVLSNQTRDGLNMSWHQLFKNHPPKQMSSPMMRRVIAYELQRKDLGGRSKSQLAAIKSKLKVQKQLSQRYKPGTRLIREWQGVTHEVMITEAGFSWKDNHWRSLSAIAKAITGAHWSGPRFFGTTGV